MALYNKPIQDEILKSYTKEQIRKIYDDKIKELSENGFYIDLICKNSHFEDIIKDYDKIYEEYNVSHENNQYMIPSNNYSIEKKYVDENDVTHLFIKVKPDNFTFKYVDFESYFKVFDITGGVVYLNSFWGIFVENKKLRIYDLIQYDFFRDIWFESRDNIYDGNNKNRVLPLNLANVLSIFLNKYETSGAIFSSFKNMIDANEKMMNHGIKECDSKLSELEETIVNVKNNKTYTLSYEDVEYTSHNGVNVELNWLVNIYEGKPNRLIAKVNYNTKNTTLSSWGIMPQLAFCYVNMNISRISNFSYRSLIEM